MNKKEFIHAFAEKAGITNVDAAKYADAFLDTLTEKIKTGDPVHLMGFGTFKKINRPERMGKRPGTGAPMVIPARSLAKYVPSKAMRSL